MKTTINYEGKAHEVLETKTLSVKVDLTKEEKLKIGAELCEELASIDVAEAEAKAHAKSLRDSIEEKRTAASELAREFSRGYKYVDKECREILIGNQVLAIDEDGKLASTRDALPADLQRPLPMELPTSTEPKKRGRKAKLEDVSADTMKLGDPVELIDEEEAPVDNFDFDHSPKASMDTSDEPSIVAPKKRGRPSKKLAN